MTIKDKIPQVVEYFTNTARLFASVIRDMESNRMEQKVIITHGESGDRYQATMTVIKIKKEKDEQSKNN